MIALKTLEKLFNTRTLLPEDIWYLSRAVIAEGCLCKVCIFSLEQNKKQSDRSNRLSWWARTLGEEDGTGPPEYLCLHSHDLIR